MDFITKYGNVGTVDEPNEYVADTLRLKSASFIWPDQPDVAYFSGTTKATIVGIGGSLHHLIGSSPDSEGLSSSSQLRGLMEFIMFHRDSTDNDYISKPDWNIDDWKMFHYLMKAQERMGGPSQMMEFLAKRLYSHGEPAGTGISKMLLLTPLYIALVD